MSVIDFAMHWNFNSATGAFGVHSQDYLYNDATYNVVYVDSHDYAPDSNYRFTGDQGTWAENLSLMFSFRGIPCLYYGSEVEFQKGMPIDKGAVEALKNTGRAYLAVISKVILTLPTLRNIAEPPATLLQRFLILLLSIFSD